jgi:universal stress protein A
MNTYKHILLAVDLSPTSQQVAIKAQQLATLNQAKLSIIHVVEIIPMIDINYETVSPFTTELNQILISNAEKNLGFFVSELKLAPEEQLLEQGDPRDEIIRVAKENHVDLIVIGSHGRHGLSLLLGSTANAILHHAVCDVLAVRLIEE